MKHVEVPIKVTVWVDEGIADLVCAMNEYADVLTIDSCEGYDDGAHVYFLVRGEVAELVAQIERWLGIMGDEVEYKFRLEWRHGTAVPMGQLLAPSSALKVLAKKLRDGHE